MNSFNFNLLDIFQQSLVLNVSKSFSLLLANLISWNLQVLFQHPLHWFMAGVDR